MKVVPIVGESFHVGAWIVRRGFNRWGNLGANSRGGVDLDEPSSPQTGGIKWR